MQNLISRLDIADPPTAEYAGRGRRFLLETSSVLRLVLQTQRVDVFCAGRADLIAPLIACLRRIPSP